MNEYPYFHQLENFHCRTLRPEVDHSKNESKMLSKVIFSLFVLVWKAYIETYDDLFHFPINTWTWIHGVTIKTKKFVIKSSYSVDWPLTLNGGNGAFESKASTITRFPLFCCSVHFKRFLVLLPSDVLTRPYSAPNSLSPNQTTSLLCLHNNT